MSFFYKPFQPTLTSNGLGKHGLTLESAPPCDALSGKVHSYLQITADRSTPYPVMPDGTQAIYISRHGQMIGGAQVKALDIQLFEPGEYFGIWFYPGALRFFFNLNLKEITGQLADETFLQCNRFSSLHSQVFKFNNLHDRAKVCETWLLRRYSQKPASYFDYALQLIYQSCGNYKISQIANKVGWSSRHLNRQFLQHTGLSTKSFSQIIRAQNACRQLYFNPDQFPNNTLELGYFDQSHLIRDFRKHFTSTPGNLFDRFRSDLYNRT